MAFTPPLYNPAIAHITDGAGNVFQVLNAAGDDWDEAATVAQQTQFYAQQGTTI
ncbi:MAG: hypothetical protein PHH47_13085 [Gallionella sp.]|nr:hypothetical protein [Gallionella sp.]MDD4947444.1 hypothetical protein [Gallionella sp.]